MWMLGLSDANAKETKDNTTDAEHSGIYHSVEQPRFGNEKSVGIGSVYLADSFNSIKNQTRSVYWQCDVANNASKSFYIGVTSTDESKHSNKLFTDDNSPDNIYYAFDVSKLERISHQTNHKGDTENCKPFISNKKNIGDEWKIELNLKSREVIISNDMEKTVISSVVFENIKVDPSIDYRFFACYDSNDGHGKIVVQSPKISGSMIDMLEWLAGNKLARYGETLLLEKVTLEQLAAFWYGNKSAQEKEVRIEKFLQRCHVRDVDQQPFITAIEKLSKSTQQNSNGVSKDSKQSKENTENKENKENNSDDDENDVDSDNNKSVKISRTSLERQKSEQVTHLKEKMTEILKNNEFNWIVCALDISGLKIVNNNQSHDAANTVINTVKSTIGDYCEHNNPARFRYYRDDSYGKGDLFALLIDTRGDMKQGKLHIDKIMEKFKIFKDISVRIGITNVVKYDKNDDATRIYDRALFCCQRAKNEEDGIVWEDFSVKRWNQLVDMQRIKQDSIIGSVKDFKQKIRDIANYGDTRYALVCMDGDNVGLIKRESTVKASIVMQQAAIEIRKICNKYNDSAELSKENNNNNDEDNDNKDSGDKKNNADKSAATPLFYGYHSTAGDEFAMFIGCKVPGDKKFVESVLEELATNFRQNCGVTFSFGVSFVKNNDSASLLEDRGEAGLQAAKKNGKDQVSWV